eukprot:TRINITY_DN49469_c0_g1_i1.p1 TRINITY_DN49469_c0_g1~~TRINITY_DN49469_c0_g1_i1.p1  ORF type:complete len:532 (+),score=90.94 TRINITY_DN49469_c0_g1_i1:65-1660(+)
MPLPPKAVVVLKPGASLGKLHGGVSTSDSTSADGEPTAKRQRRVLFPHLLVPAASCKIEAAPPRPQFAISGAIKEGARTSAQGKQPQAAKAEEALAAKTSLRAAASKATCPPPVLPASAADHAAPDAAPKHVARPLAASGVEDGLAQNIGSQHKQRLEEIAASATFENDAAALPTAAEGRSDTLPASDSSRSRTPMEEPAKTQAAQLAAHEGEQFARDNHNPSRAAAAAAIVVTAGLRWEKLAMTARDLSCLEDGEMLNDSVMDFFLRLTHKFLTPRDDVYVFSSHFFTRLTAAGATDGEVGWENVRGWTKRVGLLQRYRYAVVPINTDLHWWLAVIKFRDGQDEGLSSPLRVAWVDSLPDASSARYERAIHYLRGYLKREWLERGQGTASSSEVAAAHPPQLVDTPLHGGDRQADVWEDAPLQENGVDCGVFALDNVARFLAGVATPGFGLGVDARRPGASSTWCDQATATRRRAAIRRAVRRLQAELPPTKDGTAAAADIQPRSIDVSAALESHPEVVVRLRGLWGLPA